MENEIVSSVGYFKDGSTNNFIQQKMGRLVLQKNKINEAS